MLGGAGRTFFESLMGTGDPGESGTATVRLRRLILGKPREVKDPKAFRRLSLVAILAWVGLGADGLSSICYGPEEAFKALGVHTYLAVALAIATALTVVVISWSYSRIIEAFPLGGGGYVVPYKLLGPAAGALSGSALIVDYVLTISISVAAGVDALFSHMPVEFHGIKLWTGTLVLFVLLMLNLRGFRESVRMLAAILGVFLATHAVVLAVALLSNASQIRGIVGGAQESLRSDLADPKIGFVAILFLFLRGYSLGGGTYTGIESVANATNIMRAPVVRTAKRTMLYMSISLAVLAAGILICYVLTGVRPEPGKTLNSVLVDRVVGPWGFLGMPLGHWLAVVTIFSEAILLFLAAQAGFTGGPRVMAGMAVDSWLPHRFAALSERLTMRNGIVLMGFAAFVVYYEMGGSVSKLIVLYTINVFLSFSLSNTAMCVRSLRSRRARGHWRRDLFIHGLAASMCVSILCLTIYERFEDGGWVTLLVTGLVFLICLWIRQHYVDVKLQMRRLETTFASIPETDGEAAPVDRARPTAVFLVESYGGVGIHMFLTTLRSFPGYFQNAVFLSVAVLDSENFKGTEEVDELEASTRRMLSRYVDLARRIGVPATAAFATGTDVVSEAEKLCERIAAEYPRNLFVGGKLVFEREHWFDRLLHNETAFAIQRRLSWKGHAMTVLPVKVSG